MSYDERLIGRKPSEQQIEEIRARRNAVSKHRLEQREALLKEQHSLNEPSMALLRKLWTGDLAIEAAVKAARESSLCTRKTISSSAGTCKSSAARPRGLRRRHVGPAILAIPVNSDDWTKRTSASQCR
jgi:hypothetical protein